MERREFVGSAIETTLTGNISNTASTINVDDSSSFPTITNSQKLFVVVIDRGTVSEEKVLINANTGTVLTAQERGYDGTTAVAHSTGATVDHALDATVMQDMNDTVYNSVILNWMGL
jgi:hypothetical protein